MQSNIVNKYISEDAAIELITKLIGKKITTEDILECATRGVIPAYMQFAPKDTKLYNGFSFHFVWSLELNYDPIENPVIPPPGCPEEFWKVLPFPLPYDGLVKATDGTPYRVFVARNDQHLEAVSENHYIRVYTPQELRKTAKNIKRYLSKGDINPTPHSYCQTWIMERDTDHDLMTVSISSPFINTKKTSDSGEADALDLIRDNRERTSLHLIIAALASQAGYPLTDPNKAEVMLQRALDAMGLPKGLGGKGTGKRHFSEALRTAERVRNDSEDTA